MVLGLGWQHGHMVETKYEIGVLRNLVGAWPLPVLPLSAGVSLPPHVTNTLPLCTLPNTDARLLAACLSPAVCCLEDVQPALAWQVLGHNHTLAAALIVNLWFGVCGVCSM
jgi:hypothetical protein